MASAEVITADLGGAIKRQEKPDWKSKFITPKSVFMSVGCILLSLLAIVPIWNAFILLQDSNYIFWAGRRTPECMIASCVIIILLYAATVAIFFKKGHSSAHTEQSIIMIANIFITLFGLFLMVVSSPLTHQADLTYTNLLHRCANSEQTHRLYEYSQVLQNIRAQPECAKKWSIEECDGYEEAAPYTYFLKGMENNFRCAGFCYSPPAPVAAAVASSAPAPAAEGSAPASASLLSTKRNARHVSLITEDARAEKRSLETSDNELTAENVYPPTLFSDRNFQASCEGMAARDMKNFAGDIGQQTFYQGVYLVAIAVVTGFLKLLGFCANKA